MELKKITKKQFLTECGYELMTKVHCENLAPNYVGRITVKDKACKVIILDDSGLDYTTGNPKYSVVRTGFMHPKGNGVTLYKAIWSDPFDTWISDPACSVYNTHYPLVGSTVYRKGDVFVISWVDERRKTTNYYVFVKSDRKHK